MTIPYQKKKRTFVDPESTNMVFHKRDLQLVVFGAIAIPLGRIIIYYLQTGNLFASETDMIITLVGIPVLGAVCVPLLYHLLAEVKIGLIGKPR